MTIITVTNNNNSGPHSLRQAIMDISATGTGHEINFSGNFDIVIADFEPLLVNKANLTITGGANTIQLQGWSTELSAANITIRNIVFNAATSSNPTIIINSGADNFEIVGCKIGTNKEGTAVAVPQVQTGIVFNAVVTGGKIGGPNAADRNIFVVGSEGITGNFTGIIATDTVIENNYFGTDMTGMNALGKAPIVLFGSENVKDNVMCGSGTTALTISDGATCTATGNYIGVNAAASGVLPTLFGISVSASAPTIGSNTTGRSTDPSGNNDRPNIIAGITSIGIATSGDCTGMSIIGNVFNANRDLTAALTANQFSFNIGNGTSTTIGSSAAAPIGTWRGRNMVVGSSLNFINPGNTILNNCLDPSVAGVALCGADGNVFLDSFSTMQSQIGVGNNTAGPPLDGIYPNADMSRYFELFAGTSVVADGSSLSINGDGEVAYLRSPIASYSMGAATQFVLSGVTIPSGSTLVVSACSGVVQTANIVGPKTNETVVLNFESEFPGINFNALDEVKLIQTAGGGSASLTVLAADPHVLCLDGTRLDVYAPGFYRFYDNNATDPKKRLVVNLEVKQNDKMQDYASAVWIRSGTDEPIVHTFEGRVFDSLIDGEHDRVSVTMDDKHTGATMEFILEGVHNTLATKCEKMPPAVVAGGLMSGQIQRIASLESEERVDCRMVMAFLGATTSHALVCGSGSPHAVSFHGEKVETTEGTVTLYDDGEVVAMATFVDRRIETLTVTRHGTEAFAAKWDPSIIDQEQGWVEVSETTTEGNHHDQRICGADAMVERMVGNLFVRVQPGGVASFSVFGSLSLQTKAITGILATPLVQHKDVNAADVAKNNEKMGIYAKVMEPHLIHVQQ